uniref:Protein kinase domain-containing protein n=1 Tax=Globodera rostochiensis TaxID=31243 RepID=A0A914GXA4_GLORO
MVLRNGSTLSSDWSDLNGAGDEAATSQAIRVDELDHFDEAWVKPFPLRDGVRIRKGERFSDYYALFEEIGEGKFGKVYRCVEKASNLMLAAKCIKIRKDTDFEKVEKEVNIMTQMRHKCIAQIYDAFATTDNDVILIMEIVEGGELFDRVADDSYILTEMAVALIMFQICEAIRYIHSQHIIHLDLKPENIMCTSQTSNQIKLIDFGLAQWYDGSKDLMFMAGTPEFAAPEVIKYEPLDFHTDMWSLGVIAYILLSGQSPFLGETLAHTYCNVERGNWMFCEEFAENGISSDAKDFICKLLLLDKDRRMLPDECLRHPWIRKNRERAFLASRTASPAVCHPLAVEKFRKYVKNKRFRRLVFGVLFINQVMRMMQTMQRNKSVHGVEYVRNLLVAAESADATDPLNSEEGIGGVNKGEKEAEKGILLSVMDSERKEKVKESVEKGADGDGAAKMPGGRKKVVLVKKVPREPGEKKKRSKSEARRAAEQHRTRSSTEQTSNKKQRQEDEVGGGVTGAKSPLLSARRESMSSREPPTTRRAAAVVEKSVKFEEEPPTRDDVPKKVAVGMPVKRVSDGNVLRITARMFEEHSCCTPSTSAAEKKVLPAQEAVTTKKTVSSSNVSALLKKLEQKGQQQGAGGGGTVRTPGRSLSSSTAAATTLQLPFAVTAVAPLKKETATATTRTTGEKGVPGEEKKLKTVRVVKKKVLRLRTAEETEQRQKKREKEQKQQMTTVRERETDETEKMKKVKLRGDAEREEKRRSKKVDDGEQQRRGAEGTASAQNGHGEGTRTREPELNGVAITTIKQPQPPKTGLLSPRAKQRLKMSNSFPLGAKGGMNANNNIREDSAEEMDDAWGVVGQDVFDFSLLRKKLQNRIMGLKDQDDLETEAENQQRFELQKQQKMLRTNLNIKRAMRKWISIDKETKHHQQQHNTDRAAPEIFPDWAR